MGEIIMRRRPVNSKTKIGKGVFMGIDPDVNHTGVCIIVDGKVEVGLLLAPGKGSGDLRYGMARVLALGLDVLLQDFSPKLVVIEWQAIRPSDPRPNDILELCSVAGMALALCAREGIPVARPLPVQWKGSVKKRIHQQRIMTAYADDPAVVFGDIAAAKRNHVVDALGLALWGSQ